MRDLSHRILLALILLMVAIFLGQLFSSTGFERGMAVPLDIENAWQQLKEGEASSQTWGTLSTLLTAALMHGGWDHILWNMLFLWIFAGLIGELLGSRWMLTIFVVTAICGSLGDVIMRSGEAIPALGASGAVSGFKGAYLGLAVRWSLPEPTIWPIAQPISPMRLVILALVGVGLDITGVVGGSVGTAYGAHLGGFLTGLFLTSFIVRKSPNAQS